MAQLSVATRGSRQEQLRASWRKRFVEETIDASTAHLCGDGLFITTSAASDQHQLGELRMQAIEQRSHIATQSVQIADENAATTANQQIDSRIGTGSVPQHQVRTACFAQRREKPAVRGQHDDVYDVGGQP